jgi:hypothetical protein
LKFIVGGVRQQVGWDIPYSAARPVNADPLVAP